MNLLVRLLLVAVVFATSAFSLSAVELSSVSVYTSTREVTSLAVAPDGSLRVGTKGGIVHCDKNDVSRKYTVKDGLPSNEVMSLTTDGDSVTVIFPNATALWSDGKWSVKESSQPAPAPFICEAIWKDRTFKATPAGLQMRKGNETKEVALPESRGSHISALLPRKDKLWAALYGDGLWVFDGTGWEPLKVGLPDGACEITSLASDGDKIYVGTRREGVWSYDGKQWNQCAYADEPYAHNCQNIASYKGSLYFSTLEDGLVVKTSGGWQHISLPVLSSNSPRQMAEFHGVLYIRHGNGKVDSFDGSSWKKNVFLDLPRKQVSALYADNDKLYLGQWGGWSEFDGKTWTHNLKHSDLQGYQITALSADGNTVWIGTQGRGLAEVSRPTGKITWHDERHGLPDDWVKNLLKIGDNVYAGTFVGGMAWSSNGKWISAVETAGLEITDLTTDHQGRIIIATRKGLWGKSPNGPMERMLDLSEIQSLYPTKDGLWIGTRTGIYLLYDRP